MSKVKASILLSILFLFGMTSPVQSNVLLISKAEIQKVVGDFPAHGSDEELLDDMILLDYQDTRTDAECKSAAAQSNDTSLKKLYGDLLTKYEASVLSVKLLRVAAIAGANTAIAKKMYNRDRPYDRNGEIKPCIEEESSKSYPSGHTTIARLFARVLSLRFPKREAAFMKRANEIAAYRVIGGVHHPSDVEAGKRLGDYLAKKFYK